MHVAARSRGRRTLGIGAIGVAIFVLAAAEPAGALVFDIITSPAWTEYVTEREERQRTTHNEFARHVEDAAMPTGLRTDQIALPNAVFGWDVYNVITTWETVTVVVDPPGEIHHPAGYIRVSANVSAETAAMIEELGGLVTIDEWAGTAEGAVASIDSANARVTAASLVVAGAEATYTQTYASVQDAAADFGSADAFLSSEAIAAVEGTAFTILDGVDTAYAIKNAEDAVENYYTSVEDIVLAVGSLTPELQEEQARAIRENNDELDRYRRWFDAQETLTDKQENWRGEIERLIDRNNSALEVLQERQDAESSPVTGDPVRLATGALIEDVLDIAYPAGGPLHGLRRVYTSSSGSTGRFGRDRASTMGTVVCPTTSPVTVGDVERAENIESEFADLIADVDDSILQLTGCRSEAIDAATAMEAKLIALREAVDVLSTVTAADQAAVDAIIDVLSPLRVQITQTLADAGAMSARAREIGTASTKIQSTIATTRAALNGASHQVTWAREEAVDGLIGVARTQQTHRINAATAAIEGADAARTEVQALITEFQNLAASVTAIEDLAEAAERRTGAVLTDVSGAQTEADALRVWAESYGESLADIERYVEDVELLIDACEIDRVATVAAVSDLATTIGDFELLRDELTSQALGAAESAQIVRDALAYRLAVETTISPFVMERAESRRLSGEGMIVLIDTDGVAHVYEITADASTTAPAGSSFTDLYPSGSACTPMSPESPPLAIEPDGSFAVGRKTSGGSGGRWATYYPDGRIATEHEFAGRKTRYSYDGGGIAVRDSFGRAWRYTTNPDGSVAAVSDPLGRVWRYEYDDGFLVAATDPTGDRTVYRYENDLLVEIVRPDGATVTYEYDTSGEHPRVRSTRDENGDVEYFAYGDVPSDGGSEVVHTTGAGLVSTFRLGDRGSVTQIVDGLGSARRYTYSSVGALSSRIDEVGRRWTYRYDEMGNLVETEYPDGSVETFVYNDAGLPTTAVDRMGNRIELTWGDHGGLLEQRFADGTSIVHTYDSGGLLVATVDRLGGETRYDYDAYGHLVSVDRPGGVVTGFQHDVVGRLTKLTLPAGGHIEFTYDDSDRPIVVSYSDGTFERFVYDGRGDLVLYTDRNGHTQRALYDGRHRLTELTNPDGTIDRYGYLADGRISWFELAGEPIHDFTFDAAGRCTTLVVDGVVAERYTYDAAGRLVTRVDAEGYVHEFAYDENDELVEYRQPDGAMWRWEHDSVGRVVSADDPEGGSITCTYDAWFDPVSVTLADGSRWGFDYDAHGRIVEVIPHIGAATRVTYSPSGGPHTIARGDRETVFSYDDSGRLSQRRLPNGDTDVYRYDDFGRLVGTTDSTGAMRTRGLDPYGRVLWTEDPMGRRTDLTYDSRGRVVEIRRPDGSADRLSYDSSGRPTSVQSAGGEATFSYDRVGNLTREVSPAGFITEYSYDALGFPIAVSRSRVDPSGGIASAAVETWTYRRDWRGNVVEVFDPSGSSTRYEYDAVGRRTRAHRQGGIDYRVSYDAQGRTAQVIADGAPWYTYRYDPSGVAERTDATGTLVRYAYDDYGNLASVAAPGAAIEFAYDELDRLVRAEDGNPDGAVSLEWGPLGVVDSTSGGTNLRADYDAVGNRTRVYDMAGSLDLRSRFDQMGRVESLSINDTLVSVERNPFGVAGWSFPDGRGVHFGFSADGRITSTSVYDGLTLGGPALAYGYAYDSAGRLAAVASMGKSDPGTVAHFDYLASGRLRAAPAAGRSTARDAEPLPSDAAPTTTSLWTSSPESRSAAEEARGALPTGLFSSPSAASSSFVRYDTFSYTPGGSLGEITDPTSSLTLRRTPSGRPVEVAGASESPDGGVSPRGAAPGTSTAIPLDPLGRPTVVPGSDGMWTVRYDAIGRADRFAHSDGRVVTVAYDALGRVLQVSTRGETYRYTYFGADRRPVAAERRSTSEALRREVASRASLRAVSPGASGTSGEAIYSEDAQAVFGWVGSLLVGVELGDELLLTAPLAGVGPELVVASDGAVTDVGAGAYGIGGWDEGYWWLPGASGGIVLADTGFSHIGARVYAPYLGEFIAPDPEMSGADWFAYCAGDPINYVDPSGYSEVSITYDRTDTANVYFIGAGHPGGALGSMYSSARVDYPDELTGELTVMTVNAGNRVRTPAERGEPVHDGTTSRWNARYYPQEFPKSPIKGWEIEDPDPDDDDASTIDQISQNAEIGPYLKTNAVRVTRAYIVETIEFIVERDDETGEPLVVEERQQIRWVGFVTEAGFFLHGQGPEGGSTDPDDLPENSANRSTYGCVRMENDDVLAVQRLVAEAYDSGGRAALHIPSSKDE